MSRLQFDDFFQKATEHAPYGYQRCLAGNDSGTACDSQAINILARPCKQNRIVLAKG